MPLGDSITYGNGYDIGGGYRQYLWTALPTVQPIGTSTLDPLPMLTGKDHHEGHPGFTAPQLAAGLPGWLLATGAPDAILLHAGTNDLYDSTVAADAVESIYDSLIGSNPSAILFVAAPIISVQNHPDFVPQYAAQVAAVLARLPKLPRAMAVPMPALLSSDYWDDFHPNSSGYSKIAAAWETALRAAGAQGTTMRAGLTGGSAGAVVGAGVAAASVARAAAQEQLARPASQEQPPLPAVQQGRSQVRAPQEGWPQEALLERVSLSPRPEPRGRGMARQQPSCALATQASEAARPSRVA